MDVDISSTRRITETVTPRQTIVNAIHTLQSYAILWSVTLTVMLVDDAAMPAYFRLS